MYEFFGFSVCIGPWIEKRSIDFKSSYPPDLNPWSDNLLTEKLVLADF